MGAAPAIAHPSATLALLRDGANGVEVLMLRRHPATDFAGALVFPGGRIDAEDEAVAPAANCPGIDGCDAASRASRIAALRESYEEVQLLLARRVGEMDLMTGPALDALERMLATQLGRPPQFSDIIADRSVELAADCLVPFSRWVTPVQSARRYDAHFFLARAPAHQEPHPDGSEAVAAQWLTPSAAMVAADARHERLVFATRMNLMRLAKSRNVAEALADAAARAGRIVPLCPEIRDTASGPRIRIPPGAGLALGYDDCELPLAGPSLREGRG